VPTEIEIAVIDDDEPFRTALIESLASLGYRSDGYPAAEEYISAMPDKAYHCVIADIHMPGMSGLDLAKRLSAEGTTIVIVLITARGDIDLEVRAAAVGATCLLRKPFEINDLIACIKLSAAK
jgi:FixJ family two-component response regulator